MSVQLPPVTGSGSRSQVRWNRFRSDPWRPPSPRPTASAREWTPMGMRGSCTDAGPTLPFGGHWRSSIVDRAQRGARAERSGGRVSTGAFGTHESPPETVASPGRECRRRGTAASPGACPVPPPVTQAILPARALALVCPADSARARRPLERETPSSIWGRGVRGEGQWLRVGDAPRSVALQDRDDGGSRSPRTAAFGRR